MTKLSQLQEDRAVRDAAHTVFQTDLAFIRGDLALRGMGRRLAARIEESAVETANEAAELVKRNPGKTAALAAVGVAAIVWFARKPLASLFGGKSQRPEEPQADENR